MFGFKNKKVDSYKDYWRHRYIRDVQDIINLLKNDVAWNDWNRCLLPELHAEDRFVEAVIILSGSDNWELASGYLKRSNEIIERIESEDKLVSENCIESFPRNRAIINRTQVFVNSMLGLGWDANKLTLASSDFLEYVREKFTEKTEWDSQIQYYYINSIHSSLLANDIGQANTLLNNPIYPLSSHKTHINLLINLVRFINGELINQDDATNFIIKFRKYIDKIRDRRIQTPSDYYREPYIAPIELILLHEMYIQNSGEDIDWNKIIEIFSSDF